MSVRTLILKGLRLVRGILLTLLVLVLLLLLVVVFPVSRGALLKVAVGQAHRFLPGELTVQEISWPGLGQIELQNVVWLVAADDSLQSLAVGDTLAQVSRMKLDLDLDVLRDGEIFVRDIFLEAGPVDVPGIIQLFPAENDSLLKASVDSLQDKKSFLRPGIFPGVPSLAIESIHLKARNTRIQEDLYVQRAGLDGSLEMRAERDAQVLLSQGYARLEAHTEELMVLDARDLELAFSANVRKQEFYLESLSVTVPEAGPVSIRESWRDAADVTLKLKGQGNWTDTGGSLKVDAEGVLPGPEHLRPLLPEQFPADISGPMVGGFHLDATVDDFSSFDPVASLNLNFSQTEWLDHLLLKASVENRQVTVDTLNVSLLGAFLKGAGWVDSTGIDARLDAALEEPALVRLLGGPSMKNADVGFDLKAKIQGQWPLPGLDLDLQAMARTSDLNIPQLAASVRMQNSRARVMVNLDQGLEAGTVVLDSLQLNWAGELSHPDSLAHQFDLGVWSPMGRIALGGSGTIDTLRTVVLDSLVVVSLDSTMRTDNPATIIYGPGPRDLQIQDFHLAGSLGTIGLDCSLNQSGLTLKMMTDLLLKESFLMSVAPSDLWSSSGGADLSIKAAVDLEGSAEGPIFSGTAGVMLLPHRDEPHVGVKLNFYLVRGDSSGLGADVNLVADDEPLLTGNFRWPGKPDLKTGEWVPDPNEGLVVEFPQQEFDLSTLNNVLPSDVSLDGVLSFGAGIHEMASGEDSARSAGGGGSLAKAAVGGRLAVEKLDVHLPNRSRISLFINTEIGGTVSEPVINGEVKILSGYFRIPEISRSLLPVEGESLLWQAMANQEGATDSISGGPPVDSDIQGPVLGEAAPVFIPELDVKVEIPGNMIVNGYGLNVELEGNLKACRAEDIDGTAMVVLKGHAGVRQGAMKFMNNVFDVEKADIRFNGSAPPNPHLDIKLTSNVSGYNIILKVGGFSDDPVVDLSSEPDMNEADIIAVLLFGRPANDLDNDQRGRAHEENDPGTQLRENLAALAVVFGGAGIQNQVSNTLGVDMVEMGSDSNGDSTIMVGKFITPKVLLKYNQSLEKSGTYFMTMEYRLSQYFKLLSTYGQGEEASGLELKWTRRY